MNPHPPLCSLSTLTQSSGRFRNLGWFRELLFLSPFHFHATLSLSSNQLPFKHPFFPLKQPFPFQTTISLSSNPFPFNQNSFPLIQNNFPFIENSFPFKQPFPFQSKQFPFNSKQFSFHSKQFLFHATFCINPFLNRFCFNHRLFFSFQRFTFKSQPFY